MEQDTENLSTEFIKTESEHHSIDDPSCNLVTDSVNEEVVIFLFKFMIFYYLNFFHCLLSKIK